MAHAKKEATLDLEPFPPLDTQPPQSSAPR